MRSFVTVRGLVWNFQYSRPEFLPRLTPFVVKRFVTFGGFEHVKGFALVFPCFPGLRGQTLPPLGAKRPSPPPSPRKPRGRKSLPVISISTGTPSRASCGSK